MKTVNYKTLQIGFVNRLRNNEFSQLVSNIISVIEDGVDEVANGHIDELLRNLVDQLDLLGDVRKRSRKHHLTEVLRQQVLLRHEHLRFLKGSIEMAHHSFLKEQREDAKLLQEWIRIQRHLFYLPKTEIQSRLVHDLARTLREDNALDEALMSLNLASHFQHIVAETQTIEENFRKRNDDLAALNIEVVEIKRVIYNALRLVVRQIEVLINQSPEENPDAVKWFAQIEQHLDYYRSKLKARATRRKNSADAKVDELPETPSADIPGDEDEDENVDDIDDIDEGDEDSDEDNPDDEAMGLDDE